jgi:hypothetical protein
MGASTVGSACICASAAFMRPSTVSCVRMMRSVFSPPSAGTHDIAFGADALQHGVDADVVSARMPVMRASTPALSATTRRR